jgi:hypothetical protein
MLFHLSVGGAASWRLGQEKHPPHSRDHRAEEQEEGEEGEAQHSSQWGTAATRQAGIAANGEKSPQDEQV